MLHDRCGAGNTKGCGPGGPRSWRRTPRFVRRSPDVARGINIDAGKRWSPHRRTGDDSGSLPACHEGVEDRAHKALGGLSVKVCERKARASDRVAACNRRHFARKRGKDTANLYDSYGQTLFLGVWCDCDVTCGASILFFSFFFFSFFLTALL